MNEPTTGGFRDELTAGMERSRTRIEKLIGDMKRADTQANNLSKQIREQWQRRVELMRAQALANNHRNTGI